MNKYFLLGFLIGYIGFDIFLILRNVKLKYKKMKCNRGD